MDSNPYLPPQSALDAPPAPARRPLAVLALQVVLILTFILYAAGFVYGISPLLRHSVRSISPAWGLAHLVAWRVLILGALGFVYWAVARRKPYGRWYGAAFLGLLAGLILQAVAGAPADSPLPLPLPQLALAGDPALARQLEMSAAFLIIAMLLACAGSIVFSPLARRYFAPAP